MNTGAKFIMASQKDILVEAIKKDIDLTPIKNSISTLEEEVFKVSVDWGSSNSGTREVGTSVTPYAYVTAYRKGANIINDCTITCSGATVTGNKVEASAKSSGSFYLSANVTYGGKTYSTGSIGWNWSYYRYRGEISAIPADDTALETTIHALSKDFSTSASLSSTSLSANKYYLFAVKGQHTFVCKHAETNGTIGGCVTGQITVQQENKHGSNFYSYIIVPKSASSWNFKIN